jgi:hypothetical protein
MKSSITTRAQLPNSPDGWHPATNFSPAFRYCFEHGTSKRSGAVSFGSRGRLLSGWAFQTDGGSGTAALTVDDHVDLMTPEKPMTAAQPNDATRENTSTLPASGFLPAPFLVAAGLELLEVGMCNNPRVK